MARVVRTAVKHCSENSSRETVYSGGTVYVTVAELQPSISVLDFRSDGSVLRNVTVLFTREFG